eukprot:CAMPEP_0172686168 /NCGR_PEP_ID=MMETSP1074-20121228/20749_1 /TAXON_ID=2916 /ORGANISM="Ceratium fusus, Strain PA161109" /LENGTH=194 /DNA_ID=CAMNT_0013505433 /DNA_START=28 /DNA_END=609 /DNA_ORIENTATION=-
MNSRAYVDKMLETTPVFRAHVELPPPTVSAASVAAELPLLPLQPRRPLASIIGDFFDMCADKGDAGVPIVWEGSKSYSSIFDAEEVLGEQQRPQTGEQHAAEPSLPRQPASVWMTTHPVQSSAHVAYFNVQDPAALQSRMLGASLLVERMQAEGDEPRTLKAIRQSCCVYQLKHESNDECPVCLERMRAGQIAW